MADHDWKFHCAVLCVPEKASPKEIKDAFRRLALKYHPDRNGGTTQAKEKFQRINDSYRYLMRNLTSRPIYQEHDDETAPPSPQNWSAPPPPPKHHRRSALRDPNQPPPRRPRMLALRAYAKEGYEFLHSPKMRAPLVAACCVLVALLSMKIILSEVKRAARYGETEPSATNRTAKRDATGHILASCVHLSMNQGNFVKKWQGELNENECAYSCYKWFEANSAYDGSCLWSNKEFHQHAATEASRTVASPSLPQPLPVPGDRPAPAAIVRDLQIIYDQVPEYEGNIPTSKREVKRTDTEVFDFDFVGSVWVEDSKLIEARKGMSAKQVVIIPKRFGETSVTFLDDQSNPYRKIIYEIHQ